MPRKVFELNEVHPLDCLVVAQVRAAWGDHTWFYSRGYIRYFADARWMPCEHQLVAEAAYGVPDGYHVHHVDGTKLNNRADNLAVMSASEHHRHHAGFERTEHVTVVCPTCTKSFDTTLYRFINRNKRYCSDGCRRVADRVIEWPPKERLATLIDEIGNWSALGRMFGVSDNAVRGWAKSYDLL